MRVFVSLLLLGLISGTRLVRADVTLAPLFSDRAVLQRDKPIPIWGRGDAGEKITVTFLDRQVHATAGSDGRWLVFLEPVAARSEGSDLVVEGKNLLTIREVVVGEVWLCGGSLGVETPLTRNQEGADVEPEFPLIRQVRIETTAADLPADVVGTSGWQSPAAPTAAESSPTAAEFFFARDLFQKLGVPIGLIHTAVKAAPIEAWLSPAALASEPAAAPAKARRQSRFAEPPAGEAPHESFAATAYFNGMINPLLPYALRGVLWQEGTGPAARSAEYRSLFPATITAWRVHFGQDNFPFFWCQVPPNWLPGNSNLASLREAQAQGLALPNTGEVVAIDLVNEPGIPEGTAPQTIGRRFVLLAKNRVYGIVADDSGPVLESVLREGAALRVRLAHATSGLVAHGKPVQSLEVAGADKVFRPATAKIERETLLVSSPEVRQPVAVRYAWRNAPEANLYNGAGLPAAPFRSDDW
jgi:sialate O-acetylesterase